MAGESAYRNLETLFGSDGWVRIRDRKNPRAYVESPDAVVAER